jgi:hypothetical protein
MFLYLETDFFTRFRYIIHVRTESERDGSKTEGAEKCKEDLEKSVHH